MKPTHLPPLHQAKRLNFLQIRTWMILIFLCFLAEFDTRLLQNAFGEIGARQNDTLASITTPHGFIIFAEIADTADTRAKGLMYRTEMKTDHGMLFIFPELGHWTFWMKNTKIPLDILWLDNKGTIIHIESNVPICTRIDDHCPRHYSYKKSWQVLELNAGIAEKLQLLPGSRLTISLPPSDHSPS